MSRRERQRQRKRHRGHPFKRVVGFSVLFVVCGIAMAALIGAGWVVSVADSAPKLSDLKAQYPHQLTAVYAADGSLLGYIHSDTVYTPVAGDQLPLLLKHATVAIEDRRFYQHGALDYQGIIRAGIRDVFGKGGSLQGASTLTMQLVDNRYLDGTKYAAQHDLKYKIIQAKEAETLGNQHSKDWILDNYLNQVSYGTVGGETALGVGAASQVFFDKPVQKLDLAQVALLAGLPQSPTNYNPFLYPAAARTRRASVLRAMVAAHYITQAEAEKADSEPLGVRHTTRYSVRREPYVFDYIQQQLIQHFGAATVANGGLKVYTTLDLNKEREAQAAVEQQGGPVLDDQPAAALASIDPSNGHILALASSATYDQTKFFYPVDARRQTGSAFKVFALMTLIHDYDGDPSSTYYTSKPLAAGWLPQDPTWSVHTAEETYQGTISVTKATTVSDNTVFAQLAADLGWKKLDQTAHAMGITSKLTANPAEVIGGLTDCCTMLEMADAYATLANGGNHIAPTILSKVVFPDGSSISLGTPHPKRVFTDGETYAATKVLETVIQSGTGTAANYGCPAAGKTGTAENEDNAWFVGYTPKLSTAVWVGYPQGNIPMGAEGFGGTSAAPIWRAYTEAASNGYCGNFPQPTTPWSGTAFFGPHSAGGPASRYGNSNGSGSIPYTGTGGTAPSNPYNNPTLFAQPTTPSGTGGAAPTTKDQHVGGPPGNSGHAPGPGGGGPAGGGGGKTH
ncbi:MAG TPA: transglycosylase domain-containing protein [Solirubrobacteraceae bacterium]|nr:transglycosylase domain-containing protein [Solirubrobacteraceae bacterium]